MKEKAPLLNKRNRSQDLSPAKVLGFLLMLVYGIICLIPFVWALLVALAPLTYVPPGGSEPVGVDLTAWPPRINLFKLQVFGAPMTAENFRIIFEKVPLLARWFLNTVLYASTVSVGLVALSTLAAYAFARLRFPLRDFWFSLFLASMMIPSTVTLIPVYQLLVGLRWVDSYAGLIIPKLFSVAIVFFMRQFFLDFPRALEESAYIDGASIPRIFASIVLPNSRAPMAAQFIYVIIGTWNEFMWPLIIMSKAENYTLTLGLAFFRSSYYTIQQYMMAASLLVTLPMVIMFLIFQRQFISSNIASGVKG
ncbi:carbohydrate ABC transporter permease [Gracilinema caldarium]|uniref:carbohydrate ABC transporter permease n=1 Tax=Gracilinema caldarium TaxID=215591 RepID=UPI0026EAEF09|nr:carbohydrate ABC transporter permease [Gracilinema caldarium]